MEYYHYQNQIISNLQVNYPDFKGSEILLSMNIDYIPFLKHTC